MMPSHSMDLPVPRGTSMPMQDGKFTLNGTKTELQMCPVCITCSKYVSMSNSCFSPDGKFPFCFFSQAMCHYFEFCVLCGSFNETEYCDFSFNLLLLLLKIKI